MSDVDTYDPVQKTIDVQSGRFEFFKQLLTLSAGGLAGMAALFTDPAKVPSDLFSRLCVGLAGLGLGACVLTCLSGISVYSNLLVLTDRGAERVPRVAHSMVNHARLAVGAIVLAALSLFAFAVWMLLRGPLPPDRAATAQGPLSVTVIVDRLDPPRGLTPPPAVPTGVASKAELDCGPEDHPMVVGPFRSGTLDLEPNAVSADNVWDGLMHRRGERLLAGFLLVGSADQTPLKPELVEKFGSNPGLAQARARLVHDQLVARLKDANPDKAQSIMTLDAAPTQIGVKITKEQLANDRAVKICVWWNSPPPIAKPADK
jgi:hypothetical protein